jgi:hypothetical protein
MFRAFVILGAVFDILLALFLLLVFGYVLDSWHDPNGVWVGLVATACWLMAFVPSAAAPLVGYLLNRRRSAPGRIALVVWLPAIAIVAISLIGFAAAAGDK